MTNKAYIVASEQQERYVLEKLEYKGCRWTDDDKPTDFALSKQLNDSVFPYAIINDDNTQLCIASITELTNKEIAFDGRKGSNMSDKYVVPQKFMNELEEWKRSLCQMGVSYILQSDVSRMPDDVVTWWYGAPTGKQQNNRLIAIIRWVNGEDVFEVEKPKKWVVRSKNLDDDGDHWYVGVNRCTLMFNAYHLDTATKFDTKEEAESWANAHQEVVSVEE